MRVYRYQKIPNYFIGIDPSWSGKNKSAVVALQCDMDEQTCRLCDYVYTEQLDEIVSFIHSFDDAVIGADAPLILDNITGHRKNELEFLRTYKLKVPLYPVNLKRWKFFFPAKIYEELSELGFSFDNENIFEVYPHATIAAKFFGRLFSYKRGSYEKRLGNLKILEEKVSEFVSFTGIHFKTIKEYEDFLDAVICGYTVFLPSCEEVLVYGDQISGLFLVPYV